MQDYYFSQPRSQKTGTLFPRCIPRCSYLLRGLLFCCAVFITSRLMDSSAHHIAPIALVLMGSAIAFLLLLGIALFGAILIPRLRDMGLHPAWSLLILVPHVSTLFLLALLLVPSNAFAKHPHFA